MTIICAGSFFLHGCALYNSPVKPPRGFLYTETRAPLIIPTEETKTDQPLCHRKKNIHVYDWIFTGFSIGAGDVDLEQIAYEGNIEHIAYADYEYRNYLNFVSIYSIDVYGE